MKEPKGQNVKAHSQPTTKAIDPHKQQKPVLISLQREHNISN